MDHCVLKHGLVLFGKNTDGKSNCGEAETVKHGLIHCSKYHKKKQSHRIVRDWSYILMFEIHITSAPLLFHLTGRYIRI